MVVRRELADRLGNEGHYFNADQPRHRLVPAGPDHAQIAACAGIYRIPRGDTRPPRWGGAGWSTSSSAPTRQTSWVLS